MGSRILSRSFHVEKWKDQHKGDDTEDGDVEEVDDHENEKEDDAPASANTSAMDVDDEQIREEKDDEDEDSDDEDVEDPADVAMVPMADMLNARYGCGNVSTKIHDEPIEVYRFRQAKLFYEPNELRMVATKDIEIGEQIVS